MTFKKFLPGLPFIALITACVAACISANVSEPSACDTQQVSFPAPSIPSVPSSVDCSSLPSVTIPSESTTTTMDLSDDISKLQSVASNLNVAVTQLIIDNSNGQFDWVGEVDVSVSGNGLPNAPLATYTMPDGGASSELNVQVVMSPANVLTYLSSGPLTMTLTLQGQTVTACQAASVLNTVTGSSSLNTNVTMCISASGKVTKSL